MKNSKARIERPRVELTVRLERDIHQVLREYCFDNRVSLNSVVKMGLMMAMAKGQPPKCARPRMQRHRARP